MRAAVAILAACAHLLAPASAQESLPPQVEAEIDGLSAALDAVRRDGAALAAAAGRLQAKVATDPELAAAVRARLRTLMDEASGAPPQLEALLLPLMLFYAIPPETGGKRLGPLNLRFVAEDGSRWPEQVFIARPDSPAQPQRYRLAWTDLPAGSLMTLEVAGEGFRIAGSDCPERPSGSGSCTVTVAFDISGNAVQDGSILATYGPLKTAARMSGQGAGFPPADPRIVAPAETAVRLDPDRPGADNRVVFTVVNDGPGAMPPFTPRLGSREEMTPQFWQVDKSSTCGKATTAAGGSCTVILAFNPIHNGQETVLFALPHPAGRADPKKRGEAFGYARGFAEALPPGLLINGDPCPAPGSAAEVILRRDMRRPVPDGAIRLDTLSCAAWQRDGEGMGCADPGFLEGGTRRFWTRDVDQPWRLSSVLAEAARITCRDGRIERIVHPKPRSDDSVLHP
jgi:hypothetical protein